MINILIVSYIEEQKNVSRTIFIKYTNFLQGEKSEKEKSQFKRKS